MCNRVTHRDRDRNRNRNRNRDRNRDRNRYRNRNRNRCAGRILPCAVILKVERIRFCRVRNDVTH